MLCKKNETEQQHTHSHTNTQACTRAPAHTHVHRMCTRVHKHHMTHLCTRACTDMRTRACTDTRTHRLTWSRGQPPPSWACRMSISQTPRPRVCFLFPRSFRERQGPPGRAQVVGQEQEGGSRTPAQCAAFPVEAGHLGASVGSPTEGGPGGRGGGGLGSGLGLLTPVLAWFSLRKANTSRCSASGPSGLGPPDCLSLGPRARVCLPQTSRRSIN